MNASTFRHYRWNSIAKLRNLASDRTTPGWQTRSDPRYVTSVDREVRLEVQVEPAGFAPLVEWRIESEAPFLGTAVERRFKTPGRRSVSVGAGDNRRVLREFDEQTVRYLYDGWRALEERDGFGSTLSQYVDARELDEHCQLKDNANEKTFSTIMPTVKALSALSRTIIRIWWSFTNIAGWGDREFSLRMGLLCLPPLWQGIPTCSKVGDMTLKRVCLTTETDIMIM